MKKTITINLIVFFILIVFIEMFFGKWFSKNNFGIHMKGSINDKVIIQTNIDGKKKEFYFTKNSFGFRNKEIEASKIDVIFLGGSTTIQRYIEKKNTIVGVLNEKFKEKKIFIANAGMQGKSTYGYLCDFKYWFSKIKNLNPKYYIFYIGINDGFKTRNSKFLNCENITSRQNKFDQLKDYIFNSSFFISNTRKIKLKYGIGLGLITYDNTNTNSEIIYSPLLNLHYLNYTNAKNLYTKKLLKNSNLNNYRESLEVLKQIFKEKKITPIFITQLTALGLTENLYYINEETKKFAIENNFILIKLDEELKLNKSDFYDSEHTNDEGSKKVAEYIYNNIKNLF